MNRQCAKIGGWCAVALCLVCVFVVFRARTKPTPVGADLQKLLSTSMSLPVQDVDATVLRSFGDQIDGSYAVLVRITDSENSTFFFAILRDRRDGDHEMVLKDLQLEWSADQGFVEFGEGRFRNSPLPDALFDSVSSFERMPDSRRAINLLKDLLEDFDGTNAGRPRIARELLSEK